MTTQPRFPLASHTYFRVEHNEAQKASFIVGKIAQPQFTYGRAFTTSALERHFEDAKRQGLPLSSLALALSGARLQNDPNELDDFRRLNEQLYGTPKVAYGNAVLSRAEQLVRDDTTEYLEGIRARVAISSTDTRSIMPASTTFSRYRQYLKTYTDNFFYKRRQPLVVMLQDALNYSGLAATGWRVTRLQDASPARVHHGSKEVLIGELYNPRVSRSAVRIAVHEVYGHALRGPQPTLRESEGFAILLEQLLLARFKFRRSYRYLAGALGHGVVAAPMTFREVYEILWRYMAVVGRYSENWAKSHAYDECARVFRGGRPDLAGAVYLKDTVYFDANIGMWSRLSADHLQYNEFVDVLEGRRTIL